MSSARLPPSRSRPGPAGSPASCGDGGSLAAVQVTTVARETMEAGVHPLSAEALEEIAGAARRVLGDVPVETYP